MATLSSTCPHCNTKNVEFRSMGQYKYIAVKDIYSVFFKCGNCEKSIMATVQAPIAPSPHDYNANLEFLSNYNIIEIYPKATEPEAPPHLPDNVRNFYFQAVNSIRSKNWDASAVMSRKVLEVATKTLDPQISGVLKERIDKLASKSILPEGMKEWAHQIRFEGNIAAHEEKPIDPEDAKAILSFTDLFLRYTFTMPRMLEERKSKPTPPSQ